MYGTLLQDGCNQNPIQTPHHNLTDINILFFSHTRVILSYAFISHASFLKAATSIPSFPGTCVVNAETFTSLWPAVMLNS